MGIDEKNTYTKFYLNRTMVKEWKNGRTQIWGEEYFYTIPKSFQKYKFFGKKLNFGKPRKISMGIDEKNTHTKFYTNRKMENGW